MPNTKTILLVDDNVQLLNSIPLALQEKLAPARLNIRTAASADEALAALASAHVDLAIVDLSVINQSTAVQEKLQAEDVPTILISGLLKDELEEAAKKDGRDWRYLGKPFDSASVASLVALALALPVPDPVTAASSGALNASSRAGSGQQHTGRHALSTVVIDQRPQAAVSSSTVPPAPTQAPLLVQLLDRIGEILFVALSGYLCAKGKLTAMEFILPSGAVLGVQTGIRQTAGTVRTVGKSANSMVGLGVIGLVLLSAMSHVLPPDTRERFLTSAAPIAAPASPITRSIITSVTFMLLAALVLA